MSMTSASELLSILTVPGRKSRSSFCACFESEFFPLSPVRSTSSSSSSSSSFSACLESPLVLPPAPSEHSSWGSHSCSKGKLKIDTDTIQASASSSTPPLLDNEEEQFNSPPSNYREPDGVKDIPTPGRHSTPTCDLTSTSERQLQWDYAADLAAWRFDFSRARTANQNAATVTAAAAAADENGPVEKIDSREDSGEGVWTWPALTETTTAWRANRRHQVSASTSTTSTTVATTMAARAMKSPQTDGENAASRSTSMTTYERLSLVSSSNHEDHLCTSVWYSGSFPTLSTSSAKCHSVTSLPASGYLEHRTDQTTTSVYGGDRQVDAGDSFPREITSCALSANESFSRASNSAVSNVAALSSNNNNDPVRVSRGQQTPLDISVPLKELKSEEEVKPNHQCHTPSVKQRATDRFLTLPHNLRHNHSSSPKTVDTSINVSPSTATVSTYTTRKFRSSTRFRDTEDGACQTDECKFQETPLHSIGESTKDSGGERLQKHLGSTGNILQVPSPLHRVPTVGSQVSQTATTTYATDETGNCQDLVENEVHNTLRAFSTAESRAHRSICSLRKHAKDVLAATEEAESELRLRLHNLRKALSADTSGSVMLTAGPGEGSNERKCGQTLSPRIAVLNRQPEPDGIKSHRERESTVESEAVKRELCPDPKPSWDQGTKLVPLLDFNSSAISQGDLTETDNEPSGQKLEDYRGPSETSMNNPETKCANETPPVDQQNLSHMPQVHQRSGTINSTPKPAPARSTHFPNNFSDSEARNETPLCAATRIGPLTEDIAGEVGAPSPPIEKTMEMAAFSSVSSLCTKSESTVPGNLSRVLEVPLPCQCPLSDISLKLRGLIEPTTYDSPANHESLKDETSRREDKQQLQTTAPSPTSFYDRRDDWANIPRALGLCSSLKPPPPCDLPAPAEPVTSMRPSKTDQPDSLVHRSFTSCCHDEFACERLPPPLHTSGTQVTPVEDDKEVVITPTELSDTPTMLTVGVPAVDEFRCKLEELIRQEMVKLKRTKQAYMSRKQIVVGLLALLKREPSAPDPPKSTAVVMSNTTCTHNQQNNEDYCGDQAAEAAREGPIKHPKSSPSARVPQHCDSNTQWQPEATNENSEEAVRQRGYGTGVRGGKKVDVEKMYTEYMDTVRVNRRTGGILRREDHWPPQTATLSPTPEFYDQREDWANVPRALRRSPAAYTEDSENYRPTERPSVHHQRDFRSFAENQLGEVMKALVTSARYKTRGHRPYDPWGLDSESPPPEMLLNTARAARGGLCWFEPVTNQPAPDGTAACALRKSLEREHARQSNLYWNSFYANRNQNHSTDFQETVRCDMRHPKDDNGPNSPPSVGDLQAAFKSRMQNFVARSRGRQQWIRLSAQERHLRPDTGVTSQKRQPGLAGRLDGIRRPPPAAPEPSEVVDRNLNNFCWSHAPRPTTRRRRSTSFIRQPMDPFDQHRLLQAKRISHLLSNRIKMKVFSEKVRRNILGRRAAWV
uniref:ALMS motif domain-containing protein n=1 Tax=Schistocephalus solidus TaxID=70667 RepID=A0A0X3NSQ7_SCHSO